MNRAFVGFGANLGEPEKVFSDLKGLLTQAEHTDLVAASPLARTQPVGGPAGQPDYCNACLELETDLSARQLLNHLLELEAQIGRVRIERWGPRTVDLDLLLFGSEVVDEPELSVPHPRMHLRRFVLEPLAAFAPEARHPLLGLTARELLAAMNDRSEQLVLFLGDDEELARFATKRLMVQVGFAGVVRCSPKTLRLQCQRIGGRIIGAFAPEFAEFSSKIGWVIVAPPAPVEPVHWETQTQSFVPVVDCLGNSPDAEIEYFEQGLRTPLEHLHG